MGLKAIARMIQTMLYAKRFFPYYVYNILGGIEEDGEPKSCFKARRHNLTLMQGPALCIPLTPSAVMSVKRAEQQEPRNPSFNRSSTIR